MVAGAVGAREPLLQAGHCLGSVRNPSARAHGFALASKALTRERSMPSSNLESFPRSRCGRRARARPHRGDRGANRSRLPHRLDRWQLDGRLGRRHLRRRQARGVPRLGDQAAEARCAAPFGLHLARRRNDPRRAGHRRPARARRRASDRVAACVLHRSRGGHRRRARGLAEPRLAFLGDPGFHRDPGNLHPLELHGRRLVDGGLLNPVPVAPTLRDLSDLTVVVNVNAVNGQILPSSASRAPEAGEEDANDDASIGWWGRIRRGRRLRRQSTMELLARSLDLMMQSITRHRLAGHHPHLLIEVSRDAASFYEFWRAQELIELGRRCAVQALDRLAAQR